MSLDPNGDLSLGSHAPPEQNALEQTQDSGGDLSCERHALPEQGDALRQTPDAQGLRDYKKLRASRVLKEQQDQIVERLHHRHEESVEDLKHHIAECLVHHMQVVKEQSVEHLKQHISECLSHQREAFKEQSVEQLKQHLAECLLDQTAALKDCFLCHFQKHSFDPGAMAPADANIIHLSKELSRSISAPITAHRNAEQAVATGKEPKDGAASSNVPRGSVESTAKFDKASLMEMDVPGTMLHSPDSEEERRVRETLKSTDSQLDSQEFVGRPDSMLPVWSQEQKHPAQPAGVLWMWEHRTGMRLYEPAVQQKIEAAWLRGDAKVRLKIKAKRQTPMEIFFVDMIQYDPFSGHRRKVQRISSGSYYWSHLRRFGMSWLRQLETGHSRSETCEQYLERSRLSSVTVVSRPDSVFHLEYSERWLDQLEDWMVEIGMPREQCRVVDVHGKRRHVFETPIPEDFPLQVQNDFGYDNVAGRMAGTSRKDLLKRQDSERRHRCSGVSQCCDAIARSHSFAALTMSAVIANAIWIAIEADGESNERLAQRPWEYQFVEYMFCFVFFLELCIRFGAFKKKRRCLYDKKFCFDLCLVLSMFFETFIFKLVIELYSGWLESFALWRLLRLLWLARVVRIAPEMVVLSKALVAALRAVFFTLAFQVLVIYVFGIGFRIYGQEHKQLDDEAAEEYFGSVAVSMRTLFLHGTLLDDVAEFYVMLWKADVFMTLFFSLFIGISSFTVMNMLIGFLCDVCTAAKNNHEDNTAKEVMTRTMQTILECYDRDGDERIWRDEFQFVLQNPEALEIMKKFGTDVKGVATMTDVLFAEKRDGKDYLTFQEFFSVVERLRGSRTASVTDIVDAREYIKQRMDQIEISILRTQHILKKEFSEGHQQLNRGISNLIERE